MLIPLCNLLVFQTLLKLNIAVTMCQIITRYYPLVTPIQVYGNYYIWLLTVIKFCKNQLHKLGCYMYRIVALDST